MSVAMGEWLVAIFVLRVIRRNAHLKSLSRGYRKRAFHSSARTASNRSRYSLAHGLEHAGRTPFSIVKECFVVNEPRLQPSPFSAGVSLNGSFFGDPIECRGRSGVVNLGLTRLGMETSVIRSHHRTCHVVTKARAAQGDSAGWRFYVWNLSRGL